MLMCGAVVSIASCGNGNSLSKLADPVSLPSGYHYENLDVGLSGGEREELWHTSEGSSLVPVLPDFLSLPLFQNFLG